MTGFETVIPYILGGLGGAAVGSMMAKKPPAIAPPKPMPTVNDAAVQEAQRRKAEQMRAQRGRLSTIYTGNEERLGG